MSISLNDHERRIKALEGKLNNTIATRVFVKNYNISNNVMTLESDFKFCIIAFTLTSGSHYYRQPMVIEKGVSRRWVGNTYDTYSDPVYNGNNNTFTCTNGTLLKACIMYFV